MAVNGTGEPGAFLQLYANGTVVGTATISPDGTWSVTSSVLPYGVSELTVTQRIGGVVSTPVSAGSVERRLNPPAVISHWADGGYPFVNGTGVPGAVLVLYVDGLPAGNVTVGPDGNFEVQGDLPLGPGTYNLSVKQSVGGATSAAAPAGSVTISVSFLTPPWALASG